MTTGQTMRGSAEQLEHGRRRRYRRGRRTFQGLRAGWSSGRAKSEYTAASGRHDHATFKERADASVRCTGLRARLLAMADEAKAGYFYFCGEDCFFR